MIYRLRNTSNDVNGKTLAPQSGHIFIANKKEFEIYSNMHSMRSYIICLLIKSNINKIGFSCNFLLRIECHDRYFDQFVSRTRFALIDVDLCETRIFDRLCERSWVATSKRPPLLITDSINESSSQNVHKYFNPYLFI